MFEMSDPMIVVLGVGGVLLAGLLILMKLGLRDMKAKP